MAFFYGLIGLQIVISTTVVRHLESGSKLSLVCSTISRFVFLSAQPEPAAWRVPQSAALATPNGVKSRVKLISIVTVIILNGNFCCCCLNSLFHLPTCAPRIQIVFGELVCSGFFCRFVPAAWAGPVNEPPRFRKRFSRWTLAPKFAASKGAVPLAATSSHPEPPPRKQQRFKPVIHGNRLCLASQIRFARRFAHRCRLRRLKANRSSLIDCDSSRMQSKKMI